MNTTAPLLRGDGHATQAPPVPYRRPDNAELTASDAARLRQLLTKLRRRYPMGNRIDPGNRPTNRSDALSLASLLMADPGAAIDALLWSLDAQYGRPGRGGAT